MSCNTNKLSEAIQAARYRYITKGALHMRLKTLPVDIYLSESHDKKTGAKLYGATVFKGKAQKPNIHAAFYTAAKREQYVRSSIADWGRQEIEKAARETRKRFSQHSFTVGTILNGSWGYEQTNQEFYQVVALVGSSFVMIRPIAQEITRASANMSEHVIAQPDRFRGEAVRKRVQTRDGEQFYVSDSCCTLVEWDGKEKYQSHYA